MKRTSTSERLQRLELVRARLTAEDPLTIAEIADELGLSARTVARDIALLRDQGLPVEAERGRGGGVRLHRSYGIGRLNLTYSEAIALLVSVAIAEQMQTPLFMANLGPIRRKLTASFSPDMKERLKSLKSRILIGQTASATVLSAFSPPGNAVVESLHEAFVLKRRLEITYKADGGGLTRRTIEPHFLLLNSPVWYVLAFDHLRVSTRTFRCDRIETAQMLEESFDVIGREQFEETLQALDTIVP
ncbi:WYL domain-containing protein [Roseibium sp. SCPC15]|uniref:helix-turn-helix transcriptional regulator n=1 Tax=Roseibium sp. SCP15 TaxID=3141376 RepID=UPI00333DF6D8